MTTGGGSERVCRCPAAGSRRRGRLPIEQLADDLRRLLRRHDEFAGGDATAARSKLVAALEAAIAARAMQAAGALGVPQPALSSVDVDTEQLRRLLLALAAEGLVLPREAGLLTPGRRS
jgi:hypothetical protein